MSKLFHPMDGFFHALRIIGYDIDASIVFDVHGYTGFSNDLVDHLAAGTNDIADFLRIDHEVTTLGA